MSTAVAVEHSLARIQNLLDSVPFMLGADPTTHFLNIYKISHAELTGLDLTESRWDLLFPIPANKLLKLGISLGNLLNSHKLEQNAYNLRQVYSSPARTGLDPFDDRLAPSTIPSHHLLFARNFLIILQNFDVGTAVRPPLLRSRQSVGEDLSSGRSGLSTPASPIKLKARQLLIEKLEINIKLDCLFIVKILLQVLVTMYEVLAQLFPTEPEDQSELNTARVYSESSLMFSKSSVLLGTLGEFYSAANEVLARVTSGIVEPLTGLILEEVVEPHIVSSCQTLIAGL